MLKLAVLLAGLGVNFPDSDSACDTEHCPGTMVPWYEANFETCETEIRTMGAHDQDIANLLDFYTRCRVIADEVAANAPDTPSCEPIYLGADIGFANVMEFHDEDGSCTLSMSELATVCSVHYLECISFLTSGDGAPEPEPEPEDAPPGCEAAFLGPDIGYVDIFEYHDEDGSCTISMSELAAACADHFAECISFLDSSDEDSDPSTGDSDAELFSATGWFLMSGSADLLGNHSIVLNLHLHLIHRF